MKRIFCFIDRQERIEGKIEEFLEKLDELGNEIYLFSNLEDQINDPYNVICEIDRLLDKEAVDYEYIFMTNIPKLFQVIYRLYHQTFTDFIYYEQADNVRYELYGIYKIISSLPINEAESLTKPVFTNAAKLIFGSHSCQVIAYFDFLGKDEDNGTKKSCNLIRKYYHIEGTYYLFEPLLTERKAVIQLTDVNSEAPHGTDFTFPGFNRMNYLYEYNSDLLNQLFSNLDSISGRNLKDIYSCLEQFDSEMREYSYYMFGMTCCMLDDAAQLDNKHDILRSLILLSFLMQITKKSQYFNAFIRNTLENEFMTCENRYFIWNQCKRYMLLNKVSTNAETAQLLNSLYDAAFQGFREKVSKSLTSIPKEERDPNTIIVFTIQFLSERHAPTRTTLERCYTLAKLLGKKVLLINTKEQYTRVGELLIYQPTYANVISEYNGNMNYSYKDMELPYYQPFGDMPSVTAIQDIIARVRKWKPAFIFSIGNGSMTADLCGRIVPEAAISVAFSTLATTKATFSVIGRTIAEQEWKELIKAGYQRDSIIESTFTFELNPRVGSFTREEFGIPKDRFVLVVVGIRLDTEITDAFINTIMNTFPWGTHLVLAGEFKRYGEWCDKYPEFKEHSTFIGYCNDILALMEICDLYVNPKRLGGGFSIIEAFHEGKPGVTVRYGDVATSGGEDFCVANYEEMQVTIKRYIEDKEFYALMSRKAREREKVMTDSKSAMQKIIEKIENNPLFI